MKSEHEMELKVLRKLLRRVKRLQRKTEEANRQDQRDHGNPFRFGPVQMADGSVCLIQEMIETSIARHQGKPAPAQRFREFFFGND